MHQQSLQWPGLLHMIKGNETQPEPENSLLKANFVYLFVQFCWDQNKGSGSVSNVDFECLNKKKKSKWNLDHSVCQNQVTLKAAIYVRMLWKKKVRFNVLRGCPVISVKSLTNILQKLPKHPFTGVHQ